MKKRGFRDRDFLSTKEDLLFCVVGPYHPDERVISYLKYLPDSKGRWRRGDDCFKRVMRVYTIPNLLETFSLLKRCYPKYLFFSSVYNITMTAVKREDIKKQFMPEKKLAELLKASRLDPLQSKVVRFVSLLSEWSDIPIDDFGVTGSILLDIHNPAFSDMDITVYGAKSSYAVKDALEEQQVIEKLGVKRFEGEKLRVWYEKKSQYHPISMGEAKQNYERKWNIGMFAETLFSVHPITLGEELTEKYGDKTYYPAGIITIKAVVADSRDSIFLPAVYGVKEVEVGKEFNVDIKEVVSYEGFYNGLAEKGETIEARGKLEHVVDNRTGKQYDRILVGSPEGKGREYIINVTDNQ